MRRPLAALVLGALLTACGSDAPERTPARTTAVASGDVAVDTAVAGSSGATGSTATAPKATPEVYPEDDAAVVPEPDAWVPRRAGSLARALETTAALRRHAVAAWVRDGGAAAWPPPDDLELIVLFEQRVYRVLAAHDRLAERVLARLDGRLRAEARLNVRAGGALYDHFAPVEQLPDFLIRAPEPAAALLDHFRDAERRFGVDWEFLAAVMLIETRMGRIASNSSAGAQGPMQFIPSTWAAYGLGGDVRDERDAVFGAANYLRANGAPNDYRRALFHYNPVQAYVTAVTGYAHAMMRDPDRFYAYYNWQVFVRTTRGDVRLSGPGL